MQVSVRLCPTKIVEGERSADGESFCALLPIGRSSALWSFRYHCYLYNASRYTWHITQCMDLQTMACSPDLVCSDPWQPSQCSDPTSHRRSCSSQVQKRLPISLQGCTLITGASLKAPAAPGGRGVFARPAEILWGLQGSSEYCPLPMRSPLNQSGKLQKLLPTNLKGCTLIAGEAEPLHLSLWESNAATPHAYTLGGSPYT